MRRNTGFFGLPGTTAQMAGGAICVALIAMPSLALAQDGPFPGWYEMREIPSFEGIWQRDGIAFDPPPVGPGPVRNTIVSRQIWVGDATNPILQPHTAEIVRENGENDFAGNRPYTPTQLCRPSGVPNVMNILGKVQILQTPEMVTILYERDQVSRHIYLNQEHPADLTPSYFGHSIGHYEGDQLVVETIGFNDKTPTDRFGTPHGEKLQVVERYRIVEEWKALEVHITVTDPDYFTTPWTAFATYTRTDDEWEQFICAENNRQATAGLYPIPQDETPDF
ncbi:MAG: hypothetical protein RJB62_637 [Pseudomonadota bacterium]